LLLLAVSFADAKSEELTAPVTPVDTTSEILPSEVEVNGVERLLTPITQWVEGKIQKMSVVKPTVFSREPDNKSSGITLREAIKIASNQYQGTILGATKVEENNKLTFRIKILSSEGVVKIISVNGYQPQVLNQEMKHQE